MNLQKIFSQKRLVQYLKPSGLLKTVFEETVRKFLNSRINFLRKLEFSTIRQNQENAEKLTPCRLGPKRQGLAQNLKSLTLVTRVSEKNLKMLMLAKANSAQLIQSQLQMKIESKYAEVCSWKN